VEKRKLNFGKRLDGVEKQNVLINREEKGVAKRKKKGGRGQSKKQGGKSINQGFGEEKISKKENSVGKSGSILQGLIRKRGLRGK